MNDESRDPRYDEQLRERVRELYESGMTIREVAAELGIHRNRVLVLLNEMEVPRRRRGPRNDNEKEKA